MKRIGILGGTFAPIHNGHLQIALDVVEALQLDRCRLMPAGVPPHRDTPQMTVAQRLAALHLAVESYPQLSVDEREISREGPSYTLLSLRELAAENPQASIHFIMGVDAWNGIASWYEYQSLLRFCHVVIVMRPGCVLAEKGDAATLLREHKAQDAVQLAQRQSGLVLPLSVSQLDISSTAIRKRYEQGLSIEDWVPDGVADFFNGE